MKTLLLSLALLAALPLLPAAAQHPAAQPAPADAPSAVPPPPAVLSMRQLTLIERNVLANLASPVLEVRAETMQLVIDLQRRYPEQDFSYTTLPLLETLKNDERDEFRILAALALYHLDNCVGRFAVERRALYDPSPRVARHCAMLIRNWDRDTVSTDLLAELRRF